MRIRLLSVLLTAAAACNGQDNLPAPKAMSVEQTTSVAAVAAKDTAKGDPYFIESGDTISSHGPGTIVRNALQDRHGTLWFATWAGIIRYDGKLFTNMTLKAGLEHWHVFSILEDRVGNLWFGTIGGGVYRYDGKSFVNFKAAQGLIGNAITCIAEDRAGNIWFGNEGGVSRYDGKTFTNFTTREGLCHNSVNAIAQDRAGNIWFGTDEGVCYYDGKSFTQFKNQQGLLFSNVRSIVEDRAGNIWFGGADGLHRYDGKSLTTLLKNFVGFVFEDRIGTLWCSVSESSGMILLYRYDGISFAKIWQATSKENHQVFGIEQDSAGNIWFGTMNGIYRYDGTSFTDFAG